MMRMRSLLSIVSLCAVAAAAPDGAVLENRGLRLEMRSSDGSFSLIDKSSGEAWAFGPPAIVGKDKATTPVHLAGPPARTGGAISYRTSEGMEFRLRLADAAPSVEYSFDKLPQDAAEVLLLHEAAVLEPGAGNYYAIPHRMGILLPVEGEKPYTRRFPAYETGRGYSMAMAGAVKNGSALLAAWEDPYTEVVVRYTAAPRRLAMDLALRGSARSVRLEPLGRGGYVEIAKAYRPVARRRGFLRTLAEKSKENPGVARFFGAADFKPFAFMRAVPNTRWNKTSVERLDINFTFEECAQLAEHFAKDLGIDRALLVLNGWINGGYDNRHPDVLPAAPEIGGDKGLIECSRRVRALGPGWVLGLHDNYQDFYKDSPSWDEDYIMKNRDGSLRAGGVWAGGLAYLICSRKSLELAARPQNVPRVKELFSPDLYFSDTIFAAPPYECFDPKHPLTLGDDIKHKIELCDYMRKQVGLFGSEEGREWGVPHADYFEGLMSHKTRWNRPNDTDVIVPMFEIVFGDAIPMYTHQSDRPRPDSATYVLDHILYAEMPVYGFGTHTYWKDASQAPRLRPGSEARAVFSRGGRYNPTDQFIKNTYEVLSPLHRLTALLPMTDHRFLTADRLVESTVFGNDVRITVNYGAADYTAPGAVLPQYGFLVESPELAAFYARGHGKAAFNEPSMFVMRSLDGRPLASSRRVRIYRAFGDRRIEFRGKSVEVETETVVSAGR